MKRIILIITIFSIVVLSSKSFAHGQNTHKYMTYQAYQLLKRYFGAIPEMESHLGSVSNVYEDDYPFQTGDIIAGAYREDEEDLVFVTMAIFSTIWILTLMIGLYQSHISGTQMMVTMPRIIFMQQFLGLAGIAMCL